MFHPSRVYTAGFVLHPEVREAADHLAAAGHDAPLQVELVDEPLVIRVEEGDQRTSRFSDPAECVRSLSAAGFADVRAEEHELVYDMPTARHALDMIYRSGVRGAMLLEAQTNEARARIEEALMAGAMKFKRGDVLRFAFPAVVVSGAKPSSP